MDDSARLSAQALRLPTRQVQVSAADGEAAAAAFREKVHGLMAENDVDRMYNADQTAVFFEYLPNQSISTRREDRYVR